MTKTAKITDFLTMEQIEDLLSLWQGSKGQGSTKFHDLAIMYLEPLMDQVDRKLGQKNHVGYVAYMVEYVFMEMDKGGL